MMGYLGGERNKRHLTFNICPLEKRKKMRKYIVYNMTIGQEIGILHWRGGWRQYVFKAYDEVDMSKTCNIEVNCFIDRLMREWRSKKDEKRRKKTKD